jgi:HEAT repeat protein
MNEKLDQAFAALKTYDWGVDPEVIKPIDEAVVATHSDPAARKELEARLIAVLGTAVPQAAKGAVCRVLKTIGTAAAVSALAPMLADEKLSHMARFALEWIPGPEACQALLAALPQAAAKLKPGIIASLGVRGDAAAIVPLQALLANADAAVASAAAHALGTIGSLDAARVIVTARPSAATKAALADAALNCAERMLATGNKQAAKVTYEKLLASTPTKLVQAAASHGLQACDTK